jgi:molecular chaperone GrpE
MRDRSGTLTLPLHEGYYLSWVSHSECVQVTERTDFRDDLDSEESPSNGEESPSDVERSADGADIASTDMNPGPSSRAETTQPMFRGGREAKVESDLAELKDRHLRLAAEFDNYRKRSTRERAELADRAQASFVSKLIDVLDDLDRLVASDSGTPLPALREGLSAVDRKLWKELEEAGVERIDPVGSVFDPAVHEAVSTTPAPDHSKDQIVSATFQPGYRFKGALVRPARVQVYSEQGRH